MTCVWQECGKLRSTRYKEKQGITLIEILIAFVIMMVVMVAIIGFMTRTRTNTTFDEARVFASSLASDVMKNLMGKVPFYCIIANGSRNNSTSGIKYGDLPDTLATLDTSQFNKSEGSKNGFILADYPIPESPAKPEKYIETVLYWNDGSEPLKKPFTVRDKRGISYYISLRAEVVPIKFEYYETTVHSTSRDGNYLKDASSGDREWKSSFLLDPIDSSGGSKNELFGDSQPATSDRKNQSSNTLSWSVDWLKGDVKDARLKRLTVTILWAEWLATHDKSIAPTDEAIILKRFSLMSVKAKLED